MKQPDFNLNELVIIGDQSGADRSLTDNSFHEHWIDTRVYFRDLESRLCEHITKAEIVVGAVAWLTSHEILAALARVPHGVSIVVQKEDFLRPDFAAKSGWSDRLRREYESLPSPPERHQNWPSPLQGMSACGDPTIQPVRCMGNHNADRRPAHPRMHNKFLVFCHKVEIDSPTTKDGVVIWDDGPDIAMYPYAVWTGSFNFTHNATLSFENALYIDNPFIASAYFDEWAQIMALSEPLNWKKPWCSPEWRIGS